MENIDYTVGDDVVKLYNGIRTKEGEVYKARALKQSECGCSILVDIGVKETVFTKYKCSKCGFAYNIQGIAWHISTALKKLDTLIDISELTEVLEKPAFNV